MNNFSTIVAVIALILSGYAVFAPIAPAFGGTTNFDSLTLSENLSVGGTSSFTGDSTVSGGTLTVTTSNTATSTITGGCFQFYATSTATAHKFQASTTPGIMISQYGTCPNL